MGNGRQHSKTVKQGSGIFLARCAMGAKQAGGFPYRGSGSAKDLQGTLKGSVAKVIRPNGSREVDQGWKPVALV